MINTKRWWVFTFASVCFSMSPVLLKGYALHLKLEQAFKDDLVHLFSLPRQDTRVFSVPVTLTVAQHPAHSRYTINVFQR